MRLQQGFATGEMGFRGQISKAAILRRLCRLGVHSRRFPPLGRTSALHPIVLQKSKVAMLRIFRENKKRATIADSDTLNRLAEVTGKFRVRGAVLPQLYTKDPPTVRRIFSHLCKTTFATVSTQKPTSTGHRGMSVMCRFRCRTPLQAFLAGDSVAVM